MRLLAIFSIIVILVTPACGKMRVNTPPNLSPEAASDFTKTQVLQDIDLVRDTAISANAQAPPLLSTETVTKIVQAHKGLLKVMEQDGWEAKVDAGLVELQNDLSSSEAAILTPYITLTRTILKGVR